MDTNQQEKVMAEFSDRQKKIDIVNLLLTSHYTTTSYEAAVELLKANRIKPIISVGHSEVVPYSSRNIWVIDPAEAREYFEYLQQIASGALNSTTGTVTEAYNQLFAIIYAMRKELKVGNEQELFATQTLVEKLARYEVKISEFSQLLHARDEQIAKIYKRVGELSNEFYEHKEEVPTLNSSVRILEGKVEGLDKSTEDGFANMKIILEEIRDWIGTYKQPLEWVKSEHDKIHPVNENEKKPK